MSAASTMRDVALADTITSPDEIAVTSRQHFMPAEWLTLGCGLVWVTGVMMVTWPALMGDTIHSATTSDASVFALGGELIRRGGVPYVTFWDHKPPLIYLLNTAGLTISGGHIWGIWLLSLASFIAAIWLCHTSVRRIWGIPAAVLATTYFAFSLPTLLVADLPSGYVLPLQWAAVMLLAAWSGGSMRPLRLGAWIGFVTALAFLLKPNQIGAGVSVAIAVVVTLAARRRGAEIVHFIIGGLGATVLTIGVMLLYLLQQHALAAFWAEVIRYNETYSGLATQTQRLRSAIAGLNVATKAGTILLPGAAWLLALRETWLRRKDLGGQAAVILAVVWLPVEVFFASISGRPFRNYFAMLFAPLAYLAGFLALKITSMAASRPAIFDNKRGPGMVIGALAVALAAWAAGNTALTTYDASDGGLADQRAALVDTAVKYIKANTSAQDPIFIWGHAADLYLLSDRRPASRFIYPLPLLTPGYADSTVVRGFMAELRRSPPSLIIGVSGRLLEGEDLTPPLDRWNPAWRVPTEGPPDNYHAPPWWTMTPALKSFYDYVAQSYVLAGYLGRRWPVYRRRDAAPLPCTAPCDGSPSVLSPTRAGQ